MKKSHIGRIIILAVVLSASATVASGERWVWSDQRAERQIDPSTPPSSLPPLARRAPAGGSSLHAPSASRTPAASSFSVAGADQLARDLPLPPQEPFNFRPLSIDISKLPLETPGYSDSLEGLGHPPQVSSVLRDDLAQDLSVGDSLSGQGLQTSGFGFGFSKTMSISELGRGTPSPLRQSRSGSEEAVILTPSISELPLQSTASFSDVVTGGKVTFPSPVGLREFKHPSSGGSVTFPQKLVDVDTSNTRSSRVLPEAQQLQLPGTPPPPSVTPVPTLKNTQDNSPFLKVGSVEGSHIFKVLEALQKESTHVNNKDFEATFQRHKQIADDNNVLLSSIGPIFLPAQIESLNPSTDKSPINVVDPPQLGGLLTSADSSLVFPVKVSPPKADLRPRTPSLATEAFKLNKSTLSEKQELSKFKSFALFFKKPTGLKKERRAPPQVWVWPDRTSNTHFADLSGELAKLAL